MNQELWVESLRVRAQQEQEKLQKILQEELRLEAERWRRSTQKQSMQNWEGFLRGTKDRNEEMLNALKERVRKFYDVLKQLGWPPHGDMNLAEVGAIVRNVEEFGVDAVADAVDGYFLRKYDFAEILRMSSGWKQKVRPRRLEIMDQAIQAHNYRLYYVSVPTILAQIEGIIADNTKHKGKMSGSCLTTYLEREFGEKEPLSLEYSFLEFCKTVLYDGFGHGQPIISGLSRHAIVHGGDVDYGTKASSLKAILTFDSLQALFPGMGLHRD